jgi:hypothetical protein
MISGSTELRSHDAIVVTPSDEDNGRSDGGTTVVIVDSDVEGASVVCSSVEESEQNSEL